MNLINIPTLLLILAGFVFGYETEECPQNTMTYLSSYGLARQTDLNKTF